MRKIFWNLIYKFYTPKTKKEVVLKWERLDYYDFNELRGKLK